MLRRQRAPLAVRLTELRDGLRSSKLALDALCRAKLRSYVGVCGGPLGQGGVHAGINALVAPCCAAFEFTQRTATQCAPHASKRQTIPHATCQYVPYGGQGGRYASLSCSATASQGAVHTTPRATRHHTRPRRANHHVPHKACSRPQLRWRGPTTMARVVVRRIWLQVQVLRWLLPSTNTRARRSTPLTRCVSTHSPHHSAQRHPTARMDSLHVWHQARGGAVAGSTALAAVVAASRERVVGDSGTRHVLRGEPCYPARSSALPSTTPYARIYWLPIAPLEWVCGACAWRDQRTDSPHGRRHLYDKCAACAHSTRAPPEASKPRPQRAAHTSMMRTLPRPASSHRCLLALPLRCAM